MKLIVPRPREPHAWGRFLGFVGDRADWEIEGEIYSDSVVVAGGGQPVPGFEYLMHFRCPDTRRGPMTIIFPIPGGRGRKEPPLSLGHWIAWRQGPGRTSRSPIWTPVDIGASKTIARLFSGAELDARVWGSTIYCRVGGSVFAVGMSSSYIEAYDEDTGEFAPPSYSPSSAEASPLGFAVTDFALDPVQDGDFVFLWATGFSRVSRSGLETVWTAPFSSSGYPIFPGSLFITEERYGCLIREGQTLNILLTDKDADSSPQTVMVEQQKESGGLVDEEDSPLLSRGSHGGSGFGMAPSGTYWDASDPPAFGIQRNPWGFTNGIVNSFQFGTFVGEGRFGQMPPPSNAILWGQEDLYELTEEHVLHYKTHLSSLSSNGAIIPQPRANEYLPSLVAYSDSGSRIFEVLGWENEVNFPLHQRKLFSPRLIHGGRVYCVTLLLTFRTIDETFVRAESVEKQYQDGSFSPFTSDQTVFTRTYSKGAETQWRSRRIVGIQTLFEAYAITSLEFEIGGGSVNFDPGELVASEPLMPQITSPFPVRGAHKGFYPEEHAHAVFGSDISTYQHFLGYDIADYWPDPESYFDRLWSGDYFAYGLYSESLSVGPVWPAIMGKPGQHNDPLEGHGFYDPNGNQAYERQIIPPELVGFGQWAARIDVNNSGTPGPPRPNVAPPSSYVYETVWHEYSYDMPHVVDYFNPILNSSGSLLIYPPLYNFGFTLPTLPGKIFHRYAGNTEYYSWSGGTVANKMQHEITIEDTDWNTEDVQVFEARSIVGTVAWRHRWPRPGNDVSASRPCCADGKMVINYKVGDGPLMARIVDDQTGGLISDDIAENIGDDLPEDDNGGRPAETILAGDVSVCLTRTDEQFGQFPWDPPVTIGWPRIVGLYESEDD